MASGHDDIELQPALPKGTLGEPVLADRDLPPFDRSTMDGYALRHGEHTATMQCVGRIDAGQGETLVVPAGTCVSIATGAPVPTGLDTVIPHERTRRDGAAVHFDGSPEQGANVHCRGGDARLGDTLVPAGTELGPAEIGLLAACGSRAPSTGNRIIADVFTSGDEIVPVDTVPLPHQMRNSNGPMVCAILGRFRGHVDDHHVPDSLDATIDMLQPSLGKRRLVVTTGGISAGERDFIAPALEALGIEWTVLGAAIKPGKPIRLGRVGDTSVVCLPGNPVAALIMGTVVLGCVSAALLGLSAPTWSSVELAHDVQSNAGRELLRAATVRDSRLHVRAWQGSGDLAHTAGMNAIIRLPVGGHSVKAGTSVPTLYT